MLTPSATARAKERIVTYGYMDSGKSFAWTTMADMYRRTETPGHFHVLSTEYQMADRALEGYEDVDSNITVYEVENWDELETTSRLVKMKASVDDWLIVDSIGNAWPFVQNHYAEACWGMTMAAYMADGDRGDINWVRINSMYRNWINGNVIRFPGHVYATCHAEEVRMPTPNGKGWASAPQVVRKFGRYGVAPDAQKDLGYSLHTVLLMQSRNWDEYTITTVDDPRRERLDGVQVAPAPFGFVKSYLVDVAGWEL